MSTGQGRIKLRTKVSEAYVLPSEIENREIVFGNYEKVMYIKDHDGEVAKFGRVLDGTTSEYSVWSSQKMADEISAASGDSSTHNHDTRYYLISQVDTLVAQKADLVHSHNDLYYTETETDALLDDKVDKVPSAVIGHLPTFATDGTIIDSGYAPSDVLNRDDSEFVHVTGDETINGIKTFGSIPIVPTGINPTLDGHVTNKKYLTDELAIIDGGVF